MATSRSSSTFERIADWFARFMPKREEMARNKYLRPIAHRFLSPELWRFTRNSVPRGVALGLFCAFIIPLGQTPLAAFLALPARANMPLAAVVTLVTNPLTVAFWAVVAHKLGAFMLRVDAATAGVVESELTSGRWSWFYDFFEVAYVAAFGFFVLAVVSSALGYLLASAAWPYFVARRRAKRLKRVEDRLDQRLNSN